MIKHQLVVGILTVVIDFSIYRVLISLLLDNVNIAKGLAFVGGTFFAYFTNRFWTFRKQYTRYGSVGRFILVYIMGLTANVSVNYLSIFLLGIFLAVLDSQKTVYISFFLATGVSATLNFIGMKFFVFTGSSIRNA